MRIRPGNGAVALTAGLAIAVLLGPLVLRGDPVESARLEANRRQIAEMTEAERQRLLRNYDRWQKMSDAERQDWRLFADKLAINRASLGPVLEDYYAWLQSLPGYRREQLRQAEAQGVQQHIETVKEIAGDQLASRLDSPAMETTVFGGPFEIPILTSAELDHVLSAMEEILLPQERRRLVNRDGEPLTGLERRLLVLNMLRSRLGGPREIVQGSTSSFERILAAVPEHARQSLMQGMDRGGTQFRNRLMAMITVSVRAELERVMRELRPTPDRLQKFFDELEPAEQERLLDLAANEFNEELSRRYYRQQLETRVDIDFGQMQRFFGAWERPGGDRGDMERLRPRLDGRGPFPGERPGFDPQRRPENPDGRPARPQDWPERPPGRDGERPPPRDGDRPPTEGERPRPSEGRPSDF